MSLELQRTAIEEYCHRRELVLSADPGVLVEAGCSASVPLAERPAGSRLTACVTNPNRGPVHVVVTHLDRLFRSLIDAVTTIEAWDKRGDIHLHVLQFGGGELDTSTPYGRLFFRLMAVLAEFERELISSRAREVAAGQHAAGKCPNRRHPPYGYTAGPDGEYVPVEYELATVGLILELGERGQSGGTIARELNGLARLTRKGHNWRRSTVNRILGRYLRPEWEQQRMAAIAARERAR